MYAIFNLGKHDLSLTKPNEIEFCDQDRDCKNPLNCTIAKNEKMVDKFRKEYEKKSIENGLFTLLQ